jgi:diguanylate cyclase (GGDEF)-like protein
MNLARWLVWWCCACLFGSALAAGPGLATVRNALTQYKVDGWQTEQGLPLNTVQALGQTRDGYLWVGTGGGLARFDGARFTRFESAAVPEVASQPIFGFMQDSHDNLWVAHTRGAAIYREGRFEVAIPSSVTAGRRVWAFVEGQDGVVWAATENGLVRWQNGAIKLYQQADGLPTNRLRALAFDRDGTLWIATSGGGLVAYADGRFRVLDPSGGFPHLQVRSVLADPAGGVWASTAGGGLARVDGDRITTYTVADGLPTDQLTALARDGQGALWIGTWGGGVARLSGGRFSTIASATGLAGDQIWAVQVDREGSVWIGTWFGGLNRLRNRAFVVLGKPEGLSHDNTRAVLHARNGVTWVSTAGGGLNRIEGETITPLGRKEGLPSLEVSTLHEDRDGAIWVGTYTSGIARLQAGRSQTFGTAQGLPSAEVRALYQDRAGTLWAGTQAGLARFDGQRFNAVRDPGAPREGVSTMLQDRAGTLWIGTSGEGLIHYRSGVFEAMTKADGLRSSWIMALHEDATGGLWIGTNGEGLHRLKDGKLATVLPSDGLWDGMAQTILDDGRGNFWMTCNRGFWRIAQADLEAFIAGRPGKLVSTGYGPGDAMRGTTFAGGLQQAGAIGPGGELWLPSANGLVIVDPARLAIAGNPPEVRLEDWVVEGTRKPARSAVLLPPGPVPLTVHYTAMTLLNAERVRFRYRMEGLTRDWVDAGPSREVVFPALPHGRYQFRVAASTDGQRWSEASEPLPIDVQPRLYQTPWFITLLVLASLGLVFALFRLRTHHLRARHLEMERLVAQRTEELRLANEHLSRLSFSDALTGLANRRRFDESLQEEWRRARRSQTPLSIVIADIDYFKPYNDQLGHPQGDRSLTAVAAVFAQAVGRAGDLAARYGGEEFVVLLPGTEDAAARAVAEALRAGCEALALPHPASPTATVITLSLGVASCVPTDDNSAEALMAQADAALYRAKLGGRNRVC